MCLGCEAHVVPSGLTVILHTGPRARAQWQSLSVKVAGTLRVPSAISFKSEGYGIWKMPATFLK